MKIESRPEFNIVNLSQNAPNKTRKELVAFFGVSLSMIDDKLKQLGLKAKKAQVGRPTKFKA